MDLTLFLKAGKVTDSARVGDIDFNLTISATSIESSWTHSDMVIVLSETFHCSNSLSKSSEIYLANINV